MTSERAARLRGPEAAFYQAILREFPTRGGAPDAAWLSATAVTHGLDAQATLARFEAADVVVRDPATGAIVSMYPFSDMPTPHRVTVAGGRPMYSMCAIDALGMPFMLGRDAVIESVDPTTGTPIRVEVRDGVARWDPPTAAVLAAAIEEAAGPKATVVCPIINFFATAEAAEAYQRAHPEAGGRVLTQEEAVEHGQRFFGGLLAPDGPSCGCGDAGCEHPGVLSSMGADASPRDA